MLTTLKTAALSFAIGLTALTGAPSLANAEGVYFQLGVDEGNNPEYRPGYQEAQTGTRTYRYDDSHRYERRYKRNHDERCSPERAERKAERMGLYRVRVVDVDRRTITVRGRHDGDRVRLVFARAPGCPIVDRF